MAALEQILFGSLGKEYCAYFYYLSIFGFAIMSMVIVSFMWIGIAKKLELRHYLQMVYIASLSGVFYLQNRILYSMCLR